MTSLLYSFDTMPDSTPPVSPNRANIDGKEQDLTDYVKDMISEMVRRSLRQYHNEILWSDHSHPHRYSFVVVC
jgi:hypothetical protein